MDITRQKKSRKRIVWTKQMTEALIELYPKNKIADLTDVFNVSDRSIYSKAKELGILKGHENYRFKAGDDNIMKSPEMVEKVHNRRNETLRRDKLRLKYGLKRITKMRLS